MVPVIGMPLGAHGLIGRCGMVIVDKPWVELLPRCTRGTGLLMLQLGHPLGDLATKSSSATVHDIDDPGGDIYESHLRGQ